MVGLCRLNGMKISNKRVAIVDIHGPLQLLIIRIMFPRMEVLRIVTSCKGKRWMFGGLKWQLFGSTEL